MWSQTHLFAQSALPFMPTLTMVHRRSEEADARLSVYGVAPEASTTSSSSSSSPTKPRPGRVLVALGGLSVKGVHLLHSVVSRDDEQSRLLVTASEATVQIIGWQRPNQEHPDRERDPAQALVAAASQRLSLDTLGTFDHSWGELSALTTIFGGSRAFTVVLSRALLGLELISVFVDSTIPGEVKVRIEPERSIHFPHCFPVITSIKASRLFQGEPGVKPAQQEDKEGTPPLSQSRRDRGGMGGRSCRSRTQKKSARCPCCSTLCRFKRTWPAHCPCPTPVCAARTPLEVGATRVPNISEMRRGRATRPRVRDRVGATPCYSGRRRP